MRIECSSLVLRLTNVCHVSSLAGLGAHESFVVAHPAFWVKPWQFSQTGRVFCPFTLPFERDDPRGVILSVIWCGREC